MNRTPRVPSLERRQAGCRTSLEMMVANGTERDQQAVYYDSNGQFLRVS